MQSPSTKAWRGINASHGESMHPMGNAWGWNLLTNRVSPRRPLTLSRTQPPDLQANLNNKKLSHSCLRANFSYLWLVITKISKSLITLHVSNFATANISGDSSAIEVGYWTYIFFVFKRKRETRLEIQSKKVRRDAELQKKQQNKKDPKFTIGNDFCNHHF